MKFKVTGNQDAEQRTYHDLPIGAEVESVELSEYPVLDGAFEGVLPEGAVLVTGYLEGGEYLELLDRKDLEEVTEEPTENE